MRENGYYWVRKGTENELEIAEWTGESWYICGCDMMFSDNYFYEIGEKVERKEKA